MQTETTTSTEYFRTILDTVSDGVLMIDAANAITFANRRAVELLGYRIESLLGRSLHKLIHRSHENGNPFPLNECPIQQAQISGRPFDGTDMFWRANGEPFTADISVVPVDSDAVGSSLVVRFRDISDRIALKQQLVSSEAKFEALFNNLPVGVYRTSVDGRVLMANPALLKMLGYESFSEISNLDLESSNMMSYSRAEFRERMARDGEIIGIESEWRRKDGSKVWLRENVRAMKNDAGELLYFEGVLEDISRQKADANTISQAQTRFQSLTQTASDAVIIANQDNIINFWNPAAAKMFGYSVEETLGQPLSLIMPERFQTKHLKRLTSVANGAPPKLIGKTVEVVGQRKNGTEFPIEMSLSKWEMDGELNFAAILRDISARKQMEKLQRQYEFIVNTSNQMMTFIDAEHRFTAVSDAYCRAHRKLRQNLVGKTMADVWGEDAYQSGIKPNLDRAFAGQMFYFQGWVELAAYGRRYVKVTYSPYRNAKQVVSHVVVVTQDLTDFKQTQDALKTNIKETEIAYQQATTYAKVLQQEVVERKRIQKTLTELLEQNNKLLSAIPLILVGIRADGIISHWNEPAEKTFGLNHSAVVGENFNVCDIDWPWETIEHAVAACQTSGQVVKLDELAFTTVDGEQGFLNITLSPFRPDMSSDAGVLLLADDITQHREALEARRLLETVVRQSDESVVITAPDGTIQYVNPAFERTSGYTFAEVLGKNPRILKSGRQTDQVYRELWETITAGQVWRGRLVNRRKDGSLFTENVSISPIFGDHGKIISYAAVKHDITREMYLEAQHRQTQKMEAIGQLAAGIAHEINTPTQFIGDNVGFLQTAFQRLHTIIEAYQTLSTSADDVPDLADIAEKVHTTEESMKLSFLLDEIPFAIEEAQEGIERVASIVRAMKDFSHPSQQEKIPTDLNRAIESTTTVSRNEWKYVADMVLDFEPDLPSVPCLPGEFNQAILNIIVNAAHAIGDVIDRDAGEKGRITISTRHDDEWAEIRIADTGNGIPPEHHAHIFDPFFTTKEVGVGTGQGLAITYNIIVEKHNGTLHFETAENQGTIFIIKLPLN